MVLPCSYWVAHWHPVCLPWVSLTRPLLSTSPSPLPEPPLPALMACRDGVPHSLQPFHTAPRCHLQPQRRIFAIPQWGSAFFSLKRGMRILYIITFKMKNSLKALSWIVLVFASLLTFRLFFFLQLSLNAPGVFKLREARTPAHRLTKLRRVMYWT